MTKVLTEVQARRIRKEPRFRGIEKLNNKKTGENIDALEAELARFVGVRNAVAMDSGVSALRLAVRLAAEKIYGGTGRFNSLEVVNKGGVLCGQHVFCSDLASPAAAEYIVSEGGTPVFIDASAEDWGMDPEVLELAFDRYPDVKMVVMSHVYGFPGQIKRIKEICEKQGALLIEDTCDSMGATVDGKPAGCFGDYSALGFQENRIAIGNGGGVLLLNDSCETEKAREWILRATAKVPWDREEVGYHCGMDDVTAGIIRGQLKHLDEHIAKKKAIYEQYQEKFPEDLIMLNPTGEGTEPNYGTSCMTVESNIVFKETRSEWEYEYVSQHGTAAPMEILDALEAFGAVGGTVWKPMHMQPVYSGCDQVTLDGSKKEYEEKHSGGLWVRSNESAYVYQRGICLPCDSRMTEEEQETVIDIVLSCFNKRDMDREMWRAI